MPAEFVARHSGACPSAAGGFIGAPRRSRSGDNSARVGGNPHYVGIVIPSLWVDFSRNTATSGGRGRFLGVTCRHIVCRCGGLIGGKSLGFLRVVTVLRINSFMRLNSSIWSQRRR